MTPKRHPLTSVYLLAAFAFLFGAVTTASAIDFGPLSIGGAIRANYIQGDYVKDDSGAPQRGGNGGNFEFDTFRINLEFDYKGWIAEGEYRFYDGYHFLSTGWVGYESDAFGHLEVGVTRTPFGVGACGASSSFMFDQNYYVGLADVKKIGATYTRVYDQFTFDIGYYPIDVWNGNGASDESARYSYAVVPEDVGGVPGAYEQKHQLNIRTTVDLEELNTVFGVSAQWAMLDAKKDKAHDSDAYAAAIHAKSTYKAFVLMLQLARYEFDANYKTGADGIRHSNNLINMGAYDFAWPTATRGWIPSLAASYTVRPEIDWIDAITFYNDYSILIKDASGFNHSSLNTTGMAIARGNWYIYVDYAISDGNYCIGNEDDVYADTYAESSVGDFGANRNDSWKGRFNINIGYYF